MLLGGAQRDAVGAGDIQREAVERAVGAQAEHAAARIGDAGLPLVGEIQVAVGSEVQVVQALETLAVHRAEYGVDAARFRVEYQQPFFVAADEYAAVLMELE